MMSLVFFLTFIVYMLSISTSLAEVVILDNSNFEHLTQATTGATTGDWLVKFYAPWCGHCRKLEPIMDEVAKALEGEANVAKVDVTQNRELGTRFDIKGFPTLKLLAKGKVYTFKGRRTVNEIVDFVRGGYQIHEGDDVPQALGMFGEIVHVYRQAYKTASSDLRNGRFFTVDVFLTFMPALFVLLLALACFIPVPTEESPRQRRQQQQQQQSTTATEGDSGEDGEDEDVHVKKE